MPWAETCRNLMNSPGFDSLTAWLEITYPFRSLMNLDVFHMQLIATKSERQMHLAFSQTDSHWLHNLSKNAKQKVASNEVLASGVSIWIHIHQDVLALSRGLLEFTYVHFVLSYPPWHAMTSQLSGHFWATATRPSKMTLPAHPPPIAWWPAAMAVPRRWGWSPHPPPFAWTCRSSSSGCLTKLQVTQDCHKSTCHIRKGAAREQLGFSSVVFQVVLMPLSLVRPKVFLNLSSQTPNGATTRKSNEVWGDLAIPRINSTRTKEFPHWSHAQCTSIYNYIL